MAFALRAGQQAEEESERGRERRRERGGWREIEEQGATQKCVLLKMLILHI